MWTASGTRLSRRAGACEMIWVYRRRDELMAHFLVLHGPNLDLLGTREPELYGTDTLEDVNGRLCAQAEAAGHSLDCFQSNAEHALIERVHQARDEQVRAILINPGALTHTSIALRDAFLGVGIPFVEVHISNVHAREAFRQNSYLSDVSAGVITGFGARGYEFALSSLLERFGRDR